jgi:diacylglycerol kinase (ATP)
MDKKVKLIVNPNADRGRAWRAAADLRSIVDEYGGADWAGTVYPTHAMELAKQAAVEGYDLVIAAGGDGTVHEIANGLMQYQGENRPKMGIVPLGSGNDFSNAVGADPNPAISLKNALTGKPRRIDVGRLEVDSGRFEYWVNTVGIGFDTTVTIRSRKFTLVRGFLIYFLAVIQTILLNHDALRMVIETDREQWEEDLLMFVICNGAREGGGFFVAPDARVDDGIFHYTGIKKVSRAMMFRILPEVMNGTHGKFKEVRMGELRRARIKSDRSMYIHTDGEIFSGFGMDVRAINVEILPGQLEVII